ncbi:unnamed protein product [Protopolystoma xenopodis]|uniref:Uncharacterized protein n=1 Tax=Protopolystoma xenopodis TaxID=117903 RepID=A0A3S5CVN1_9PLAT|nr:unnamed protein product [Protopolystoma xenopodis]
MVDPITLYPATSHRANYTSSVHLPLLLTEASFNQQAPASCPGTDAESLGLFVADSETLLCKVIFSRLDKLEETGSDKGYIGLLLTLVFCLYSINVI